MADAVIASVEGSMREYGACHWEWHFSLFQVTVQAE